jgi:hypothetical protein
LLSAGLAPGVENANVAAIVEVTQVGLVGAHRPEKSAKYSNMLRSSLDFGVRYSWYFPGATSDQFSTNSL